MFIFAEWGKPLQSMGLVHIIGIVSALLFGILGGILAKRTKRPEKVYCITGIAFIVLEALKFIFIMVTPSIGFHSRSVPWSYSSFGLSLL